MNQPHVQHRRLRHGHDLAGRHAAGQAARDARRRLLAGHAAGARHRRATPSGVDAAVRAVRDSGLRVTGFQVLRDFEGLSRPPARLQDRHRQVDARDVRARSAPTVLLVCSSTVDARHAAIATRSRATCASSRCWRCRSASRSPTRACRGAARSTSSPTPGTSCAAPTRRTSASASIRSTRSRPRPRSTISTCSIAGQDLPRAARRLHVAGDAHRRGAHRHGAALSRLSRRGRAQRGAGRARDAARRAGLPRRLQLRGVQRRLQQMPLPTVAERARRSAIWLGEDVLRRSVPLPNQIRLRQR